MDASVEETLRRFMSELAAGVCETYYAPLERWFSLRVYPFREGMSTLIIAFPPERARKTNESG